MPNPPTSASDGQQDRMQGSAACCCDGAAYFSDAMNAARHPFIRSPRCQVHSAKQEPANRAGTDPARPDPATMWEVGAAAVSVEVMRLGPDYLSGVEFGLRVNGKVERTSWEYPDADLLDVTTRLYRRWASGSE